MVVMIGVWLNSYLGGFAWDGTSKEFNLHPLCMVCGIIFIYGEGMFVVIYIFLYFLILYNFCFSTLFEFIVIFLNTYIFLNFLVVFTIIKNLPYLTQVLETSQLAINDNDIENFPKLCCYKVNNIVNFHSCAYICTTSLFSSTTIVVVVLST